MKKTAMILLTMVLLVGCTTVGPRMTREQFDAIAKAESEGLIQIGMTRDEVRNLLGEPQWLQKGTLNHPKWEFWRYTSHSDDGMAFVWGGREYIVIFQDDKVIKFGRQLVL